jgi:hypothetical protein
LKIKEWLFLGWIFSSIGIGVVVFIIGLYLYFHLLWLVSIEETGLYLTLTIAILGATSTFWYRLIPEIEKQYETHSRKTLDQLKGYLIGIRSMIENKVNNFQIKSLEGQKDDANREIVSLINHVKFFTIKLSFRLRKPCFAKNIRSTVRIK